MTRTVIDKTKCIAYTSSVCARNGQENSKGAFAAMLTFPELTNDRVMLSGSLKRATNSLMELESIVQVLDNIPLTQRANTLLIIKTTAGFISSAFRQDWVSKWTRNNWTKSNGNRVSNIIVWKKIIELKRDYYHVSIDLVPATDTNILKTKGYAELALNKNKTYTLNKFKITG